MIATLPIPTSIYRLKSVISKCYYGVQCSNQCVKIGCKWCIPIFLERINDCYLTNLCCAVKTLNNTEICAVFIACHQNM